MRRHPQLHLVRLHRATDDETLDQTTAEMDADTIAARYSDDGQDGLTLLGCSDLGPNPFQADQGTTHLIQVGRYRGSHSSIAPVTLRIDRAPAIEADFLVHPQILEALTPAFFNDQTFDPASGQVESWAWDFGDGGTSTEQFPTHRYLAPGDYDVTLAVKTEDGRTDSVTRQITVHPFTGGPVTADFTHGPTEPFAGQETFFRDTSIDPAGVPIADWQWSFDDGGTATGNNTSHAFTTVGEHDVTLTVTTEDGRTGSTTKSVTVLDTPGSVRRLRVLPTARDDCRPGHVLRPVERPDRTARRRLVMVVRRWRYIDRPVAEPPVRRGRRLHGRADDHDR